MVSARSPLTPQQLEQFRQRLEEEAEHLQSLLAALERGLETPGQGSPRERSAALDEDAAAELTTQEQYGVQALDVGQARRAVAAALKRLEAGTYGLCTACGQPIPVARLEALPTAERCVPCEQRREATRPR